MAQPGEVLRFSPLQSVVDVSFLSELSEYKLNVLKLSEEPVEITGYFSPNRYDSVPARLQLDVSSLRPDASTRLDCHAAPGRLLLFNTVEGFRGADKAALMRQAAAEVWRDVVSGAAEAEPWRLTRFLLLVHGDLKHYKFHYWFAFPALKPPRPFTLSAPPTPLAEALPPAAVELISAACTAWRYPPAGAPASSPPPAAADSSTTPAAAPQPTAPAPPSSAPPSSRSSSSSRPHAKVLTRSPAPFWLLSSPQPDFSRDVQSHPLSHWGALRAGGNIAAAATAREAPSETLSQQQQDQQQEQEPQQQQQQQQQGPGAEGAQQLPLHVLLVFSDASHQPAHPAWQLRNALLMAAARWRVGRLRVLCLRESSRGGGRLDPRRSVLMEVDLPAMG
ncbi:hypothetical protein Agub_g2098, partial [Astrephomene gubernaculifera]